MNRKALLLLALLISSSLSAFLIRSNSDSERYAEAGSSRYVCNREEPGRGCWNATASINATDDHDISASLFETQYHVQSAQESSSVVLDKALNFVENQLNNYDADKWLCRATPNSSDYWIYNDNYLVYKMFVYFNRSDSANKIKQTIEGYGISIEGNDRLEVLFNQTISFPPYTGSGVEHSLIIDSSSNGEKFTVRNDEEYKQISDWEGYADLLLFGVIDRYYRGNSTYQQLWNEAYKMFDGKGMADYVFSVDTNGTKYETYKLALFVVTSRIIGNQTIEADNALRTVWRLQNETNGGVTTHYFPDLTPDPNATQNVETTCFAIYATIPEFPPFLILLPFMALTLLMAIIYKRNRTR